MAKINELDDVQLEDVSGGRVLALDQAVAVESNVRRSDALVATNVSLAQLTAIRPR